MAWLNLQGCCVFLVMTTIHLTSLLILCLKVHNLYFLQKEYPLGGDLITITLISHHIGNPLFGAKVSVKNDTHFMSYLKEVPS